jgi:hypothetical protein
MKLTTNGIKMIQFAISNGLNVISTMFPRFSQRDMVFSRQQDS